ncbi:hypothetical protein JB92DRAFT_2832579 [Gautieria morchelliformis]|nr:hypothetical protein JB92DRAFT_2832579 [Gautieria morchelliformis]
MVMLLLFLSHLVVPTNPIRKFRAACHTVLIANAASVILWSAKGHRQQATAAELCNFDAYTVFQHAEAVAKYYNAHSPAYAPPRLAFPAPHASHPPLPAPRAKTPANPVDKCSGPECQTRNPHKRNSKCLYGRCSGCCDKEFEDTKVAGTFRRECAAHMKRTRQWDGPVNPTLAQTPRIPILLVPNPTSPKVREDIPIPARSTQLPNSGQRHLLSSSISDLWSETSMAAQIRSQAKRASQVVVRDLKQVSRTNVNLIVWHSKLGFQHTSTGNNIHLKLHEQFEKTIGCFISLLGR